MWSGTVHAVQHWHERSRLALHMLAGVECNVGIRRAHCCAASVARVSAVNPGLEGMSQHPGCGLRPYPGYLLRPYPGYLLHETHARRVAAGSPGRREGHGLVFYGSTDWLVCANTSSTW